MPRIDDRVLRSVFYLYPSVEDAEAGEEVGGTGFRVSVDSELHPNRQFVYAVTNAHVIQDGSSVIRTSSAFRSDSMMLFGKREIVPLGINQWKLHPDGDDLAVAPLGSITTSPPYVPDCIPSFTLLTHDVIRAFDIGPGDDVYMVGRFVHHAGKYLNDPSVRSGIISLMPSGIETESGVPQEAFLIEMRSISGHSGSPVMWKLPLIDVVISLERAMDRDRKDVITGPWLIGIDCGAFNFYNDVIDLRTGKKSERYQAKSHAGQSVVIPAWKLQELLDLDEFVIARKEEDRKLRENKQNANN